MRLRRKRQTDKIFNKTVEILKYEKKLSGKKIVITSGGTIEDIDPVRYISNYSSGKMGLALADAAYNLGAEVTLITTKNVFRKYNVINVKSAFEMKSAVESGYIKRTLYKENSSNYHRILRRK